MQSQREWHLVARHEERRPRVRSRDFDDIDAIHRGAIDRFAGNARHARPHRKIDAGRSRSCQPSGLAEAVDNGPGRGARRQTLSPKPPRANASEGVCSLRHERRLSPSNKRCGYARTLPSCRSCTSSSSWIETRCIARPACVVVLDYDREPLEDSDRKNLTLRDRAERSRLARGLFALTCYWITAKYLTPLNL